MSPPPAPPATPLTRRRVLQLAGAAVLAGALGACGDDPGAAPSSWARIAAAARAQHPELTPDRAAAELDDGLTADRVRQPSAALRDRLAERSRDDFAAGRTVVVTGWLLSRTEVLLAVLVADDER